MTEQREEKPTLVVVRDEPQTCGHEIGRNHKFVCILQPGHTKHGIPHHYFGSIRA